MSEFVIRGGNRLSGSIRVQGAKNSILPLLAATLLTEETCVIHNCPRLSDVDISIEILRRLKLSYPSINIEWVIMGEGEMFHSQQQTAQPSGFEDKLLKVIQEKDTVIREQAEDIGKLRERIAQLQREKGKNASDAQTSNIANAG